MDIDIRNIKDVYDTEEFMELDREDMRDMMKRITNIEWAMKLIEDECVPDFYKKYKTADEQYRFGSGFTHGVTRVMELCGMLTIEDSKKIRDWAFDEMKY